MWLRVKSAAAWLSDYELWPLAFGVALATFTQRWAAWGLGLVAALWLVRWVGRGHLTVRTPLEWPVTLLLLTVPATFYATTDARVTFTCVSRMLAGLALVYGLANYVRRGAHVSLVILGLTGVGLALVLVSPVTVGWFSDAKSFLIPSRVYAALPTLVGDTIHPNMMAGALVLLLPFPLALLSLDSSVPLPSVAGAVPPFAVRLLDTRWLRRLWGAVMALLMLAVLLLTKSRGGWIAGAVVIFLFLVRRWRYFLALIPVMVLGVGLLAWRGDLTILLDGISTGGAVSGWEGRIEIWSRALYMIQDFPFTGIGMGTFSDVANALYPFFLAGPDADVPHAHNLFLQVAVDLGYPGLIAFVSILLLSIWCAIQSVGFYDRRQDRAMSAVAWAGLASLAGMLVHGSVDATTWAIGRGAFVPWAVIGTLIALNGRPAVGSPRARTYQLAGRQRRGWLRWVVVCAFIVTLLTAGGYLALRTLHVGVSPGHPTLRLPIYPAAQGVDVRSEASPADAGWVGSLEIATFTTTHSITDVVAFYTGALAGAGWETNVEAGDATSWGGIYTRNEGYSVCLLNVFDIEGEVWASIVCGDKAEPVDIPSLSHGD
jgi:putative inorganic carbon (HCO3(-)) transporter